MVDEHALEAMEAFGVPPELIAKERAKALPSTPAKPADPECEVWEENWPSWLFFLKVQTQWIWTSGMAVVRMGLNYPAVESTLRMAGIPRRQWPALLDDLQVIEVAVLDGETKARAEQTRD